MNDKTKPQDDLSIEEILGSIRRIIAEDDEPEQAVAPEAQEIIPEPSIVMEEEEDDEPLELTNKIDPEGMIIDLAEPADYVAPAPVGAEPSEPEQIDFVEPKVETPPQQKFDEKIVLVEEPEPMALHDEDIAPAESLVSASTAEATSAVMARLARHTALLEEGAGPTSGPTVEGIVREMLKPMLKAWLDENLPSIVQKMVEREIERLTKHL